MPLGLLGETYYKAHGEKIYFCENDAEFLCVFCQEGPTHQAHTVGFLDEAIHPYRVRSMTLVSACSGKNSTVMVRGWGADLDKGQ